jgi:hypothetical protein
MTTRLTTSCAAAGLCFVTILVVTACGADPSGTSGVPLSEWRDQACAALTAYSEESEATTDGPASDEGPGLVKESRQIADDLRAIPLPTELRAEAEEFVAMFATTADSLEKIAPRIEEASRRLRKAMDEIDPDSLPPVPEAQTVAGGIMSQMMSVPEVQEAWNDMMEAYDSVAQSIDEKKGERLIEQLGLGPCEEASGGGGEERLGAAALARCGARGSPISLAELVKTFRANGITLDIDERACKESSEQRSHDATNFGPSGLESNPEVERKEGSVLCSAYPSGTGRSVIVNKYSTDYETHVGVLNINCSVYPSDIEHETEQVARVRKALAVLVRDAP